MKRKKCGSTHVFMIPIANAAQQHTHTYTNVRTHFIYNSISVAEFVFPFTDRLKSLLA